MQIVYSYDVTDKIAFANYHTANSPICAHNRENALKRGKTLCYLLVFSVFIILFQAAYIFSSVFIACLGIVLVLLSLSTIAKTYNPENLQENDFLEKYYSEKSSYITNHEALLEIKDANLIVKETGCELIYNKSIISEIITTDDYIFIYLSEPKALIIPKGKVVGGNFEEFFQKLQATT